MLAMIILGTIEPLGNIWC